MNLESDSNDSNDSKTDSKNDFLQEHFVLIFNFKFIKSLFEYKSRINLIKKLRTYKLKYKKIYKWGFKSYANQRK